MIGRIKNVSTLVTTKLRRDAVTIMEAAYEAIDTEAALRKTVSLDGTILRVGPCSFNTEDFDRVKLIGFGKVSCVAIAALESILGRLVKGGIAIDVSPGTCEIAETFVGTHPLPSVSNVAASAKLAKLAEDCTARDLVLVVVSGGGSALLCWPESECTQGARLYEESVKAGMSIQEMNLVRKHLSALKGGGLAKLLFPATVAGLVFCDVPGGEYETVASGPTYLDASTIADAQAVLDRYHIEGFALVETPKEQSLFDKVCNVPVVSNLEALRAMSEAATRLGYAVVDLGATHYEDAGTLATTLIAASAPRTVVIAGGEPRVVVSGKVGRGGRCEYTALSALPKVGSALFVAFSSDGADNGPAAGAFADTETVRNAAVSGLDQSRYLAECNAQDFFEATNNLIQTGPTGSNVSDLFMVLSA